MARPSHEQAAAVWLRRRVLEEWRGLPQTANHADRWDTAADAVRELVSSLGLGEKLCEQEVRSAWAEIVGDFIAAHSHPESLREGVLYVKVVQPAVRFELERHLSSQIRERLQARFGAKRIRSLRFGI